MITHYCLISMNKSHLAMRTWEGGGFAKIVEKSTKNPVMKNNPRGHRYKLCHDS